MIEKEILNDNTDITANSQQVELLKKNFPQCFDKDGNFIVHKMEEIVGESGLELSKESYSLNWLGKSYARLLANENPRTLLKEDKEHNAKELNKESENLLIKGDNLEVLKHLSNAYAEKIKMIYIDPPYNTGSDGFVYNDDRKFKPDELSRLAGIDLEESKRILEFTQSNANSHSAWLTFMYPRLYVARHLLKEDGVIFISIDDNEQAELKLLIDGIFGEENFIAQIANTSNPKGRSDDKFIATAHEYIFVVAKNITKLTFGGFEADEKILKRYNKVDEKDKVYREMDLRKTGDSDRREDREQMFYYFYYNKNKNLLRVTKEQEQGTKDIEIIPLKDDGSHGRWRWGIDTAKKDIENLIAKFMPNRAIWGIFEKDYLENRAPVKATSSWTFKDVNSERGSEQFIELGFKKEVFPRPKPIGTIKRLLQLGVFENNEEIVLDFFAGSGTTAHAVMQLNAEDGVNHKFITVQIAELTDPQKEAYKSGYKTIFDITKARIEKAAEKVAKEHPNFEGNLGFKVYETISVWDDYLDDIEILQKDTAIFDGGKLSNEDLEVLLTTWKVHDGMELSHELKEINLAGYKSYLGEETLYLLHTKFSTEALKTLIEKIDSDKEFEPSRVVLFGYNFASKHQRELSEALSSYANKKSIELDLLVRY